ncbi:MAG: 50S ribosomal protein L3 N(5)-glutamine methyltransferase [Puniceicoccales bacterium]|jgi:ribosomal protein L3 glutamine methyltransferase|nr:50S ribosomal protein L3 N(5)-glutamine methyltransferase [Puniceicoccales bacterium]
MTISRGKKQTILRLPGNTDGFVTLRDWVRYAVSLFQKEKLFFGQGSVTPFDEAVYLLQHTLHLPHEGLETFLDARLTPEEVVSIKEVLVRRVLKREPAAYITGEAWLGELSFRVDPRVIIPRSYFLEIIPEQLNQWIADPASVSKVADVCTGSGCLAILLALSYPHADVDATDISASALEVAALNVADYHMEERIALHRADVLEGVAAVGTDYDIIVCNPPYEPESVIEALPEEFRHEPEGALISGADGLDVIRKLLPQAAAALAPHGILLIEVGGLHDVMEAEWPDLEIHWLPTQDESDCIALIQATSLRKMFPVSKKSKSRK